MITTMTDGLVDISQQQAIALANALFILPHINPFLFNMDKHCQIHITEDRSEDECVYFTH